MSLDLDSLETPAQAFARKMSPSGQTVIDRQTGEVYNTARGILISEQHC